MVYELIQQLLSDSLVCDPEQISMQSDLRSELELSDGDLADILQAAADELSIPWRRQDLEELNTVSDLVSYVENRV
ncbi:MAG TPA: acyl carrier protein [Candidatus Faecousia gallistercoris]|nr:acyl carrier protein [Candidatus Faecousia gallistercoris]